MKKVGLSLTFITVLLVVMICNHVLGFLMAGLNATGITQSATMYNFGNASTTSLLLIVLLLGGISCLILIFVVGFTVATGILMITTKFEAVELENGGLVGGILMIISGGILLIPLFSLAQPFLFLLALYFFLKPQVDEKYYNYIYAGIGICVVAFVIGIFMVIMVLVTQNYLLNLGGFLTNSMFITGFILLLIVTRKSKENIPKLTPVPMAAQYPYGYQMQYGQPQAPPGYYYPPPGQHGYPQQGPPGYPPQQPPPGYPPPQQPRGGYGP